MKKGRANSIQDFLFSNRLEELEDELSKKFSKFFLKFSTVNSSFTDWLVDRTRRRYSNLD